MTTTGLRGPLELVDTVDTVSARHEVQRDALGELWVTSRRRQPDGRWSQPGPAEGPYSMTAAELHHLLAGDLPA